MADSHSSDPLLFKSIRLNGKVWTVASKFEGIGYHYLVCEDEEEPILRADSLLNAAFFRFGQEVDPNA